VASHRQHPGVDLLIETSSQHHLIHCLKPSRKRNFTPEEFFAVGFSLVERPGDERNLGRDLLAHGGKFAQQDR
jgi:hypothetical protein